MNQGHDFIRFEWIKLLLAQFISAASDSNHIEKINGGQELSLYENIQSYLMSVIDINLKISIFNQCEFHMLNQFQSMIPRYITESLRNELYQRIMTWILMLFNDKSFIRNNSANYFMSLYHMNIAESVLEHLSNGRIIWLGTQNELDMSFISNILYRTPIDALYRWLMLIYELKFIYIKMDYKFMGIRL
ncbi:hypothetical protein RF11_04950 [Thelohanellus kitauei]|uniref:Uncharacterized protein n=1 Tax=Thelohanellus kitauei TaxID=669202 RepID=A0A0C2MNS3_THEKT|nr:hypothetical protein RF11_04950 [Thelohanellus kitauei]